jgi:hypothetical protein
MSDLQARLDALGEAIDSIIVGGQAVSYEGRVVTKADLSRLLEEEKRIEVRLARQSRGGGSLASTDG